MRRVILLTLCFGVLLSAEAFALSDGFEGEGTPEEDEIAAVAETAPPSTTGKPAGSAAPPQVTATAAENPAAAWDGELEGTPDADASPVPLSETPTPEPAETPMAEDEAGPETETAGRNPETEPEPEARAIPAGIVAVVGVLIAAAVLLAVMAARKKMR